ncbi:toprim domain-containing protein, partial [Clostridium baratii]
CFGSVAIGPGGRGTEFFHNKVEIRGGVHSEAVNTALLIFFEERAKERGIRIKNSDYSGKLSVIVSSLSNKISYRGQTKDSLDDMYVFRCIEKAIEDKLQLEWNKGNEWLLDIVDEVIQNAENRIAVAELSKNIREVEKAVKSAKVSDKFKSCDAYEKKQYDQVEFWIFEGDSAGNSGKNARDSRYQCLIPIRGKSLNVFKATVSKIISNQEIKDLTAVLGCGVDMGIEGVESFNRSKLKVGKVIIGADADIDGCHIRMLLFLIFFKLFPELLYEGLVYFAETPRFVITLKNGESIFCLDDDELKEQRAKVGEFNIAEITRFKGLGELNADQLWETTMNPETRNLVQIKIDRNDTNVYDTLEAFFGKNTDRRKKAILGSMMGEEFETVMENIEDMLKYIDSLDLADLEVEEVVL